MDLESERQQVEILEGIYFGFQCYVYSVVYQGKILVRDPIRAGAYRLEIISGGEIETMYSLKFLRVS